MGKETNPGRILPFLAQTSLIGINFKIDMLLNFTRQEKQTTWIKNEHYNTKRI